jgi:RimJ/RimL family protein N-acetyltransferase
MSRILPALIARVIAALRPRWSIVELKELSLDEGAGIETYVEIEEAARLVDAPWWPSTSLGRQRLLMQHGWDGEPGRHFLLLRDDGTAVGCAALHTTEYDNLDASFVEIVVHPDHRRRGHGTEAMRLLGEQSKAVGRTKMGWYGWEGPQTEGFAASLGEKVKSVAVCRRQFLQELEPGLADRLYDEARAHADGYALERIVVPSPEELLPELAEATAAINDAPLDDIDVEDEVFSPERVRAYERTQLLLGFRVYRIIARHVATGEIAGLSVVTVDGEAPTEGHQHDTSVVGAHRGHRLGQLLKADMMRWLAEVEPQLEQVDTFNAESNAHMVAVNERLGYRVMSREPQYQTLL